MDNNSQKTKEVLFIIAFIAVFAVLILAMLGCAEYTDFFYTCLGFGTLFYYAYKEGDDGNPPDTPDTSV